MALGDGVELQLGTELGAVLGDDDGDTLGLALGVLLDTPLRVEGDVTLGGADDGTLKSALCKMPGLPVPLGTTVGDEGDVALDTDTSLGDAISDGDTLGDTPGVRIGNVIGPVLDTIDGDKLVLRSSRHSDSR